MIRRRRVQVIQPDHGQSLGHARLVDVAVADLADRGGVAAAHAGCPDDAHLGRVNGVLQPGQ